MQIAETYRQHVLDAHRRLDAAFRFENDRAPYLIYDVNYWLFGEVPENIPDDYCSEDPSSMIAYQVSKIKRHEGMYQDCFRVVPHCPRGNRRSDLSMYPEVYKSAYVRTVTRGEGWVPGQKQGRVVAKSLSPLLTDHYLISFLLLLHIPG